MGGEGVGVEKSQFCRPNVFLFFIFSCCCLVSLRSSSPRGHRHHHRYPLDTPLVAFPPAPPLFRPLPSPGHARARARTTHTRNNRGKKLRTVRLCILDLLLENVEQRGPNLAHLLLGLLGPSSASTAAAAAAVPKASVCLEAVVGLLKSPMIMEQEPRLAEKWCVRAFACVRALNDVHVKTTVR